MIDVDSVLCMRNNFRAEVCVVGTTDSFWRIFQVIVPSYACIYYYVC